ncbi:hypothetical protein [Risungbinella massiliensis]|uniref:hypothetical protein n=1 Tax=Risungbinella massiliensis TaxID=1329796 RepID=UPI0005CC626C|nr:hypothetical protein [Risungbinella massiliensis]
MSCFRKRKKKCCNIIVVPRRRRRVLRTDDGARAIVNNIARAGSFSGLIPINVQIPINLGDANAFNRINGSASANNIL